MVFFLNFKLLAFFSRLVVPNFLLLQLKSQLSIARVNFVIALVLVTFNILEHLLVLLIVLDSVDGFREVLVDILGVYLKVCRLHLH